MEKKQITIFQEFLDPMKSGVKTFELRKDPNLDGINELVVLKAEHMCNQYLSNCLDERERYESGYCEYAIKDKLTVKMTKRDFSVYQIAERINYRYLKLFWKQWYEGTLHPDDMEKMKMYDKVNDFLIPYSKDNKSFYWYDVEVIKNEKTNVTKCKCIDNKHKH
ncbi:hypothetical protein [Mesoplasma melaleucae]|uniref:Uncharacterized protein n=1 Tax=Mesoplasma melaleucae TaxID=81459 RepID=A0A2K8NWY4_9MOLU|nr:hypothetical protein [Mesoplasma melaleucae]ATZ18287.1 hypothetical protein EMELA_v1c08000 [Mesoplasma melaleucae]